MDKEFKSDHTRALVPIESWYFGSPELFSQGISIDIGLLAESLIYYDKVLVNVSNQPQFASILEWFIKQGRYSALLELFRDDIIQIYEYSFLSTAVYLQEKEMYLLRNIQDTEQEKAGSFEKRFLYHKSVEQVLPKRRQRQQLYKFLRDKVIEAKANDFGDAINTANKDFTNPQRSALIVQAFINELYRFKGLGEPPKIYAKVIQNQDGTHTTTVNADFNKISEIAGEKFNWNSGSILTGGTISNRFLLTASRLNCDLFLPRPMDALVGDKLFESSRAINKSTTVIENLKTSVEFPDVRLLVNQGHLDFDDIMYLRKEAKKFRDWLQSEAERDRDAIIAYHNEVAKKTGLAKFGSKYLSMFGNIGGAAIGGAIGGYMGGAMGGAIGGVAGNTISHLTDVSGKINAGWKPVVFGEWMRERVEQLVKNNENS